MCNTLNDSKLNEKLKDITVMLFDLDGTIADTEYYHWISYDILLEPFQIKLSKENVSRYVGNTDMVIYSMIKQDYNIEFDELDFFERRIKIYLDLVENSTLMPYPIIENIIKNHSATKYILSSQRRFIIEKLLLKWNLSDFFSGIYSVSDDNVSKQEIMQQYKNAECEQNIKTVASFEDANKYLKIAKETGLLSVAVESNYNILHDYDVFIPINQ